MILAFCMIYLHNLQKIKKSGIIRSDIKILEKLIRRKKS